MSWALKTSIRRSYSAWLASRLFSLYRQDPKAPDGVWRRAAIASGDSKLVSIRSSVSAPMMPFRPA